MWLIKVFTPSVFLTESGAPCTKNQVLNAFVHAGISGKPRKFWQLWYTSQYGYFYMYLCLK